MSGVFFLFVVPPPSRYATTHNIGGGTVGSKYRFGYDRARSPPLLQVAKGAHASNSRRKRNMESGKR